MRDKSPSNKSGQAIVEVMVAMSIIFFGILGVFQLASRGIALIRVTSDRYVASYLAAEGIEIVKNIIDANVLLPAPTWNSGLANGQYEIDHDDRALQPFQDRALLYDSATGIYGYGTGQPTSFKRTINIENLGGGFELKVNSRVSWRSRGGTFDINLEDRFLNWQ